MEEQRLDVAWHALLDRIVSAACLLGWQASALVLHDETTQTSVIVAASATDPALQAQLHRTPPASFGPPPWRAAEFALSQSFYVLDPASSAIPIGVASARGQSPSPYVITPLVNAEHEIGWLVVSLPHQPGPPSEPVIRTLEVLADQAVLTLQQAQQHQALRDQATRERVFNRIAQAIVYHDEINELLATIAAELEAMFQFVRVSICLRGEQVQEARVWSTDPDARSPYNAGPLESIAHHHILDANEPYRLRSNVSQQYESEAERQLLAAGINAYVCLPLTAYGGTFGVLSLASAETGAVHLDDLEFLQQIAEVAAGPVWNGLMSRAEVQRRKQADALANLARIVNSTLELQQVLDRALEQIEPVIPFDSASIMLLEDGNLQITAVRGFSDPEAAKGITFDLSKESLASMAIRGRQVRIVPDVRQNRLWNASRPDIETTEQIRAWLGAPLVVRDESIGILTLDKAEPDAFHEEDGEIASAFAAQIAIAIQNARLFRAAEQQRIRLASILTDTTDAVIVLDTESRIWLLNPAAERYLKVKANHVTGEFIGALRVPELIDALAEVQRTDKGVMAELNGPDNTAFHASIAPVRGVGWVIVMQDITPLKELDKLRTDWVAAVSHDLKNPIQVIQLGASVLEMDGPLNADQIDRLRLIQQSATQLSELVTDVLDLARLEAGPALRLAPLDVGELVQTALSEISHLARKKDQSLLTDIAAGQTMVRGDASSLKRALLNVVSNAIKYAPERGRIMLRVSSDESALHIDVIDNGRGIPAEALPHVFDRFYRVPGSDSAAEGTGLGLNIVKSIIEKHHGTVGVTSTVGKGSTFTLSIPLLRVPTA